MARTKHVASRVAVIGDLVASRQATDRRALHDALTDVLARANESCQPIEPLAVTTGDEFQGVFATIGAAAQACLRVRLLLLDRVDTRFGLGRGDITVLDAERRTQDGPAWWRAREAIEWVALTQSQPATRAVRTAYRSGPEEPPGQQDAVNAALLCRDQLLQSLDERSVRILRGMVDGHTQSELAAREGVSDSAVSQRVRRDGLAVVLLTDRLLGEVP